MAVPPWVAHVTTAVRVDRVLTNDRDAVRLLESDTHGSVIDLVVVENDVAWTPLLRHPRRVFPDVGKQTD